MSSELSARLRPVRLGACLSLLTILYAFGLGASLGLKEDALKGHLQAEAAKAAESVYQGDAAKAKAVTAKAWVYLKRAHMHAAGLGAIGVAVSVLLALSAGHWFLKTASSLALGLGALGYSVFWMLAALRAPGMGSTGAAKESLGLLAMPAAGLCVFGILLAMAAFCRTCCCGATSCDAD